jgi:hypothetical protein
MRLELLGPKALGTPICRSATTKTPFRKWRSHMMREWAAKMPSKRANVNLWESAEVP